MKRNSVVVVAHPDTGRVVTPHPTKEGEASIRLDQEIQSLEGGYFNQRKRTVFIGGKQEELEALNYRNGTKLPGKIVQQESFEPFYEGQSPKINPTTGEVIQKNGQDLYFQFVYTEKETTPDYEWFGADANQVSEGIQNALAGQTVE